MIVKFGQMQNHGGMRVRKGLHLLKIGLGGPYEAGVHKQLLVGEHFSAMLSSTFTHSCSFYLINFLFY